MILLPLALATVLSVVGAPPSAPPSPRSDGATPPRLRSGSINSSDYPPAAIIAGEQGSVSIILNVSPIGAVTACRVDTSSGSASLDLITCAIARQRFKFEPGRNASGERAASVYRQSVRWVLPVDSDSAAAAAAFLPAFEASEIRLSMAQDSMGARCAIEISGAIEPLAEQFFCPAEIRVAPAELARDPNTILTITRLTPDGEAAHRGAPVRGILLGRIVSEIEVRPDGYLASCRDLEVPGSRANRGNAPSFCQALNQPFAAFRPDSEGRTRRGRVEIDFYRLGAPET